MPAQDVPDVVQAVLCAALASERTPSEPDELLRWVFAIARHKIADSRRRSGRMVLDAVAIELAPSAGAPDPDARRLLRAVLTDASSPDAEETLDSMLREHAGESLSAIATEQGIAAPTLRKRVSRLRGLLRSKFAWSAALVLVFAGAALGSRARSELTVAPFGIAPEGAASVAGVWYVQSYVLPEGLPASERAALALLLDGAEVRIGEGRVRVASPVAHFERPLRLTRVASSSTSAELLDVEGMTLALEAHAEARGQRLVVTSRDGASVVLSR